MIGRRKGTIQFGDHEGNIPTCVTINHPTHIGEGGTPIASTATLDYDKEEAENTEVKETKRPTYLSTQFVPTTGLS